MDINRNTHECAKKYLNTIVFLRAIAAMSVVLMHVTLGLKFSHDQSFFISLFRQDDFLRMFTEEVPYGFKLSVGVQIFFIISGFIMPYSLYYGGYSLKKWWVFIKKRILRIETTYIVSIVAVISLDYIASLMQNHKGLPFHIDVKNIIINIFYLTECADQNWISVPYWTLAIEAQFYLIISLAFPLFSSKKHTVRLVSMAILIALFIILKNFDNHGRHVFLYLDFFIVGIATFQFHVNILTDQEKKIYLCIFPFLVNGYSLAIVSSISLLILKVNINNPVANFFGKISFSLYLLHYVVASKTANLLFRIEFFKEKLLVIMSFQILTSIAAAYIFYFIVEKPFSELSKRIRYS